MSTGETRSAAPVPMPLLTISAPGIVGAFTRRVDLAVETLVVCDNVAGTCSHADSRGFHKLSGSQPLTLGPRLELFEALPGSTALRRYEHSSFLSCATFCAGSGLTFFCEGHNVFTLDACNVVCPIGGLLCESGQPRFWYPAAIAAPGPGVLLITDSQGLHIVRLASEGGCGSLIATSVTTLWTHDDFGQLGVACGSGGQVLSSGTAIYKQCPSDCGLSPAGSPCWQPWAGTEGAPGCADGNSQDARFSSIIAVCVDGDGSAAVVDALPDGTSSVRVVDTDGNVKTVYNSSQARAGAHTESHRYSSSFVDLNCSASVSSLGLNSYDPDTESSSSSSTAFRCPLVLADGVLALCAPLQDALLVLHVPGLRAPMGLSAAASGNRLLIPHAVGEVPAVQACTTSCPVAPAAWRGSEAGCDTAGCCPSLLCDAAESSCCSSCSRPLSTMEDEDGHQGECESRCSEERADSTATTTTMAAVATAATSSNDASHMQGGGCCSVDESRSKASRSGRWRIRLQVRTKREATINVVQDNLAAQDEQLKKRVRGG